MKKRLEPQYKMLCKHNNSELWAQYLNNEGEKLDTPFYFMDYEDDRERTPRVWDSGDLVDVIKYLLMNLYQSERALKYSDYGDERKIAMGIIIENNKIFIDKVMECDYILNYKD